MIKLCTYVAMPTSWTILSYILYISVYPTAVNFLLNLCSVSSLAWFMSNQETSFVTIGQRVLANPLRYSSEINCTFTV